MTSLWLQVLLDQGLTSKKWSPKGQSGPFPILSVSWPWAKVHVETIMYLNDPDYTITYKERVGCKDNPNPWPIEIKSIAYVWPWWNDYSSIRNSSVKEWYTSQLLYSETQGWWYRNGRGESKGQGTFHEYVISRRKGENLGPENVFDDPLCVWVIRHAAKAILKLGQPNFTTGTRTGQNWDLNGPVPRGEKCNISGQNLIIKLHVHTIKKTQGEIILLLISDGLTAQ